MPDKYPLEILPQPTYRHYIRTCLLLSSYPDLTIARRVDCEDGNIFADSNTDGKRELDTNKIDNLYGWSVNLLGGPFDADMHSAYKPNGKRVEKGWDGKSAILVPELGTDYNYVPTNFIVIYFKVSDIHLVAIPYFKSVTEKDYTQAKERAEKIANDFKMKTQQAIVGEFQTKPDGAMFTGRTMLNHYPTDLNYWHFQVDMYKGTDLHPLRGKDKPKGEVDRIKRYLRKIINETYRLDCPDLYHINRKYYIRNISCLDSKIDCIRDKF